MWQFVWLLGIALLVTILLAGTTGQWIANKAMSPIGLMTARAEGITADITSMIASQLQIRATSWEHWPLCSITYSNASNNLSNSCTVSPPMHPMNCGLPLASLRTVGEVALSEPRTAEQYRDAISSILEETQRLNQTIDSLLLLARAEAGNSEATSDDIALAPLVEEVTGMLSVLAEEKSIQLLLQGEMQSSFAVYGERSLLRIALINVLHNAIKFSPRGGIVRITLATNNTESLITVSDQGPGLREDEINSCLRALLSGTRELFKSR